MSHPLAISWHKGHQLKQQEECLRHFLSNPHRIIQDKSFPSNRVRIRQWISIHLLVLLKVSSRCRLLRLHHPRKSRIKWRMDPRRWHLQIVRNREQQHSAVTRRQLLRRTLIHPRLFLSSPVLYIKQETNRTYQKPQLLLHCWPRRRTQSCATLMLWLSIAVILRRRCTRWNLSKSSV